MLFAVAGASFRLAALARKSGGVRLIGCLSAERISPDARDFQSAFRTMAVRREGMLKDSVAIAAYEKVPAAGAIGIYQATGLFRQIPGVDIMQSGLSSNFGCTLQVLRGRLSCGLHLVVWVKRVQVPRDIR